MRDDKERRERKQHAGDEEPVLRCQQMQHPARRGQGAAALLQSEHSPNLGYRLAYVLVMAWHVEQPDHHRYIGRDDGRATPSRTKCPL